MGDNRANHRSPQPNGNVIRYKIVDGTAYHADTPEAVVVILEQYRKSGKRIDLSYGDATTGRDWLNDYGRVGRLGRSTGQIKIPVMLESHRTLEAPLCSITASCASVTAKGPSCGSIRSITSQS